MAPLHTYLLIATLALLACEKEEDERLRLDLPGPNAPGLIVGVTGGFCPSNCRLQASVAC